MILRDQLFSGYSVNNTDEALFFYKQVLGLDAEKGEMSVVTIRSNGKQHAILYPKPDHTPASFTVLNIPVTDMDEAVEELTGKGISFLHYNTEYIKTDSKGIFRDKNGPTIAWFTDPFGNIVSLIQD